MLIGYRIEMLVIPDQLMLGPDSRPMAEEPLPQFVRHLPLGGTEDT